MLTPQSLRFTLMYHHCYQQIIFIIEYNNTPNCIFCTLTKNCTLTPPAFVREYIKLCKAQQVGHKIIRYFPNPKKQKLISYIIYP